MSTMQVVSVTAGSDFLRGGIAEHSGMTKRVKCSYVQNSRSIASDSVRFVLSRDDSVVHDLS